MLALPLAISPAYRWYLAGGTLAYRWRQAKLIGKESVAGCGRGLLKIDLPRLIRLDPPLQKVADQLIDGDMFLHCDFGDAIAERSRYIPGRLDPGLVALASPCAPLSVRGPKQSINC